MVRDGMLGHQLPRLPAIGDYLRRLPELLTWLDAPLPAAPTRRAPVLSALRPAAGETVVAPRGGHYWGGRVPLESVRFAGANHLLVEFNYHGKRRLAEPYSLRRAGTGNLLLYAWETAATHITAFKVDEIRSLVVSQRSFVPRHRIELLG